MRDARRAVCAVLVVVAALGAVAPAVAATGQVSGSSVGDAGQAAGVNGAATGAPAATGASLQCDYPFTSEDNTGTEVTIEEAPERIVTLAPSAAQTLWEFGAQDKVVGVTDNALYLEGADQKEIVAEGQNVQVETVIGLEPDVVIAPNVVGNDTVETLRSNGLTVYRFESADDFEGIYRKTELIGQLSGECDAAEATVTDMRERVTAIRDAVEDEDHPGALYTFYGWTAGNGTFIDAILETAGTTNVAAEAGIEDYGDGEVSGEVIANRSDEIEWLVLNSDETSHPSGDGVYNQTTAMQEDQVVVLNVNYLNQPAPRTVQALENLTEAVHPEAYEAAQASLEATATPTATATATESGDAGTDAPTTTAAATDAPTETTADGGTVTATDEPATTDGSGPGFGAAAGVIALLSLALLGRRR